MYSDKIWLRNSEGYKKLLKSSKLSDRFKKKDNIIEQKENKDTVPLVKREKASEKFFDLNGVEPDLQSALLNKIDSTPFWFEYSDLKQRELIRSFVDNYLNLKNYTATEVQREELTKRLHESVSGFGKLDYLLSRDNVSSVFVNGSGNVHIDIEGKILNTEMTLSEKQLNIVVNNIFKLCGVEFDKSKYIWNLKDEKYSIAIIFPPVSQNGINIAIYKPLEPNIETFFEKNITSKEVFDFLVYSLSEGKNIVISGEINSCKTFFLSVLINALKTNKRFAILEKYPQLSVKGDNLLKFILPDSKEQDDILISNILQIAPELIFADLNYPLTDISEKKGSVITLRASSVESAITKLVSAFIYGQSLPEKYAKQKVLTDYDYIVQINKVNDGSCKVTSVVELKPARTLALSVKTVAKLVDGQYITDIPQPLTSIRAGSIISQGGSMYSRFYRSE